jgi:hypothetical protein
MYVSIMRVRFSNFSNFSGLDAHNYETRAALANLR